MTSSEQLIERQELLGSVLPASVTPQPVWTDEGHDYTEDAMVATDQAVEEVDHDGE